MTTTKKRTCKAPGEASAWPRVHTPTIATSAKTAVTNPVIVCSERNIWYANVASGDRVPLI